MNSNNESQGSGSMPQHGAGCMCPACQAKMGKSCMCGCGSYGMRGGYGFRILRWIFAFVILVIVFMFGFKIGELRGLLESRFGSYRTMGGYGQMYPMTQSGGGMMPGMATSTAQ